MNTLYTTIEWKTFLHASYVAFVFSVLFFGALAYRQILDNLEVRRLRMGEDKDAFMDARMAVVIMVLWFVSMVVFSLMFVFVKPSIYSYALPLILLVQCAQLTLRLYLQRTQIKTRGVICRTMFLEKVAVIEFENVVVVRLIPHRFWVHVVFGLPSSEVGFRIFSPSAYKFEAMITSACRAPVLWTQK